MDILWSYREVKINMNIIEGHKLLRFIDKETYKIMCVSMSKDRYCYVYNKETGRLFAEDYSCSINADKVCPYVNTCGINI